MNEPKSQPHGLSPKKAYRKPRLLVYGDIRMLTRTSNVTGVADASNKGTVHKTA